MRRLHMLGLLLGGVLVLSGLGATSAFALPTFLPEGSEKSPVSYEGESGETVFETSKGSPVKCLLSTLTGMWTSPSAGTFHIRYRVCTGPLGESCESPGAGNGIILMLGPGHVVFDLLPVLHAALLLLLEAVHATCLSIGNILVLMRGSVLLLIAPINAKTKTLELTAKESKGKEEGTTYWNAEGKEQTAKLEESESEKGFVELGLGTKEQKINKLEREKLTIEGEVMA